MNVASSVQDAAEAPAADAGQRRSWLRLIGVAAFSSLLSFIITWPQLLYPDKVADHFDPYFSTWRLGHMAHALTRWPVRLFDGDIFYPAKGTLAYSDATLLQGLLGAPLFWAGLSPTFIYNLLIFAGFVGSGVAIFVLARHLIGATAPSLVAVAVFTMLPYRIEHLMHLELQWAMFIPLAFWAVHRTAESGRWKHGIAAGLFVWLQFLSCIYYGVFLSMALIVFVPLLLTFRGHVPLRRFLPPLVSGGILAAVLTLPYMWPYFDASRSLGGRQLDEITRYSAHPISYLATSEWNRVWGWTADRWGDPELRLFPGLVALLMAGISVRHRRRRVVMLYAVVTLVMVELSFGLNGALYRALLGHVSALQGFRALARFGMLAGAGIAILAALGIHALLIQIPSHSRRRTAFVVFILVVMTCEYSNRSIALSYAIPAKPADVYKALAQAEPGAMVEFPLPDLNALPGWDPYYEAWQVWHWRPILNGYSGFYPGHYMQAVTDLRDFPDAHSIQTLRTLNVRYVMIHRGFYEPSKYVDLALRLAATSELRQWGSYRDAIDVADIFEVQPSQ